MGFRQSVAAKRTQCLKVGRYATGNQSTRHIGIKMNDPHNPDPHLDDSLFAPWNWTVTEQIGCLIGTACFLFAATLFLLGVVHAIR